MTPTCTDAAAILSDLGIHAEVRDGKLFASTGSVSGNLACLCVTGGAQAIANLNPDVFGILGTPATFQGPQCTQFFYQCSQFEPTRHLQDGATIHGDQDSIETYPSPGWVHIKGSFRKLPQVSWADHCKIVDLILAKPELPEMSQAEDDLVYRTMRVTEDNVAQVFEHKYKDELRYCDVWGKWLRWNESRWEAEHTLLAFHYSRSIARKVNIEGNVTPSRASFARGVESFCRASRTFATTPAHWDKDCWLLNTPKGTYDLETGQLRAHRQTDHITKCTNVAPAEGRHPVFDLFMQDITLRDASLVEYLQRALGACLSGAIQDNFLIFAYGTGQNGKNTLGDLVTWILGDYAKVIPTDTLLATKNGQHPTTLANLRGLRLAVCSEVSEGAYWDEARVKSLTGDAEISARFMRQDFFEFKRTHKHLVYGNHRPLLRIVDPGMRSRLHIVPFKAYFPPEARDPNMRRRLESEAPAILHWLIEGHAKWLEHGYLKQCSAVQKETEEYFDSQGTNDAWLEEFCRRDDESLQASAKDLYASFKAFKESRGEGIISQTRWGEWMSQRFIRFVLHGRIFYRGIDLKPASVLDFRPNY